MTSNLDTLVTVFGGSGFLGRSVVRALCKRDYRVRVAVRRPELAGFLQPSGKVGQVHTVQANLRYPASVEAAMRDSQIAINLVGILVEGGAQSFDAVQAKGPATIARAVAAVGGRMVHVSAIGADENSPSGYGRSKAAGEQAVLAAVPSATILRPSLMFGPEDQFTNRFAALARMSPALPLIGGGETRMQPAYVGDVATAVAEAVDGNAEPGATYELGGPEVLTMREIMEIILEITDRKRALVSLPFGLAKLQETRLHPGQPERQRNQHPLALGDRENDFHDLAHGQHFRPAEFVGRAGLRLAVDGIGDCGGDVADIGRLHPRHAAADQRQEGRDSRQRGEAIGELVLGPEQQRRPHDGGRRHGGQHGFFAGRLGAPVSRG